MSLELPSAAAVGARGCGSGGGFFIRDRWILFPCGGLCCLLLPNYLQSSKFFPSDLKVSDTTSSRLHHSQGAARVNTLQWLHYNLKVLKHSSVREWAFNSFTDGGIIWCAVGHG